MKKTATFLTCLLASSIAQAAQVNYQQMSKQLSIMDNIISSSIAEPKGRNSYRISSIESTYLQGQGAVFTIRSSSRHGGSWGFDFAIPPLPPLPPKAALSEDQIVTIEETVHEYAEEHEIDIEETIAKAMKNASHSFEREIELVNHQREEVRELREEQRDLAYELRDVERELRDINYRLKRSDKDEKKELEQEFKELESKREKLRESRKALNARSAEFSKKQQAEQQKRAQLRDQFYTGLSQSLADTLCLYGNGLKALPKGEHVTMIIKSGGELVGREYQDKIHVFSKRSINGCAIDEITAEQLLEKSSSYQF